MRHEQKPAIVYFGMMGVSSAPPLEALLTAGFAVRAIILPRLESGSASSLPALTSTFVPSVSTKSVRRPQVSLLSQQLTPIGRNLREIARDADIPLLEVGSLRAAATLAAIAAYQPAAICVSCFPHRFPPELLHLPHLGVLNVHPSLLPTNRGPDPLFWAFRHGDKTAGVTVHLMDEELDSGPILRQAQVEVPDGSSEYQLEMRLVTLGAELLVQALGSLASGKELPVAQDDTLATNYGFPEAEDYVITPDQSAHWAFNFACGVYRRPQPLVIAVGGQRFRVMQPLDFDEGEAEMLSGNVWHLDGGILSLRCTPGVLRARVERLAV